MKNFLDAMSVLAAEAAAEDAAAFDSPCSAEEAKESAAFYKSMYNGKPLNRAGGNFFHAGNRKRSSIIKPDVVSGMAAAGLIVLSPSKNSFSFV